MPFFGWPAVLRPKSPPNSAELSIEMSESVQRMLIFFGFAMVGMIALLVALQIGFGSLAEEEPQMINARSIIVAAIFAAGITLTFGPRPFDGGDKEP